MKLSNAQIESISKQVSADDLPGDLPEIAELIGCYKALLIAAHMGVGRIYLKRWSDDQKNWSTDMALMVDIVGIDDAKIIATNFNGAHIDIPKCDRFWKAWVYNIIRTSQGMSDNELARIHNYSARHIARIKKGHTFFEDQLDLF